MKRTASDLTTFSTLKGTVAAALSLSAFFAAGAQAAPCARPPGFVDTPAPRIAPAEDLLSHTEEVTINRPLAHVLRVADSTALEDVIDPDSSLPSVTGTFLLTPGNFDVPGARRITCLSDGSTLVEQILVRERAARSSTFRYVVWNYTSPDAKSVDYSVGQFVHTERAGGYTHVSWTYSFQLRRDRFPGSLGSVGNFLFRKLFLESRYAEMMRNTLNRGKERAENEQRGA